MIHRWRVSIATDMLDLLTDIAPPVSNVHKRELHRVRLLRQHRRPVAEFRSSWMLHLRWQCVPQEAGQAGQSTCWPHRRAQEGAKRAVRTSSVLERKAQSRRRPRRGIHRCCRSSPGQLARHTTAAGCTGAAVRTAGRNSQNQGLAESAPWLAGYEREGKGRKTPQ